MDPFIPLLVIVPIFCAILLNLSHGKDTLVKALALIFGISLPIIPIFVHYGNHFFGGYSPLFMDSSWATNLPSTITNSILTTFHPAITYVFGNMQQIFIFLLGLLAFIVIFTSLSESKRASGVYAFLIFMGTAAVTAVFLTDDIFHLYIFFEISVMTQVGIILCSKIEKNHETALKYMFLSNIAAPMLLLGIGILLGLTGNVNITDIVLSIKSGVVSPNNPVLLMALALILFGWLYGSGLPPFHSIKSAMYSKATPHAAALLQVFTVFIFVALGIVILRIFAYVKLLQWIILIISALAMILGITMAITQSDFKRMIGYLAVGELGYIGLGLGIGTTQAITAGLFQAVNEILLTGLLFIGVGTILHKTGTTDTNKLGGLLTENSFVAFIFLLGGLAMAGVPPFNAFQSKLLLIQSALNAGFPELGVLMIILSIVTFMTFVKVFYTVYLKPRPEKMEIINENIPQVTVFSMVILLIVCLMLGLFPNIVTDTFSQFAMGLL